MSVEGISVEGMSVEGLSVEGMSVEVRHPRRSAVVGHSLSPALLNYFDFSLHFCRSAVCLAVWPQLSCTSSNHSPQLSSKLFLSSSFSFLFEGPKQGFFLNKSFMLIYAVSFSTSLLAILCGQNIRILFRRHFVWKVDR